MSSEEEKKLDRMLSQVAERYRVNAPEDLPSRIEEALEKRRPRPFFLRLQPVLALLVVGLSAGVLLDKLNRERLVSTPVMAPESKPLAEEGSKTAVPSPAGARIVREDLEFKKEKERESKPSGSRKKDLQVRASRMEFAPARPMRFPKQDPSLPHRPPCPWNRTGPNPSNPGTTGVKPSLWGKASLPWPLLTVHPALKSGGPWRPRTMTSSWHQLCGICRRGILRRLWPTGTKPSPGCRLNPRRFPKPWT